MPESKSLDKYANFAAVTVQESAANTLTLVRINFPFSIADRVGLIINRLEYRHNSLGQLLASGAFTYMALVAAPSIVDITNEADPAIVDWAAYNYVANPAATAHTYFEIPLVRDLSTLPGGGILVAPNPLFFAIKSVSALAACSAWLRMYYTYVQMSDADYFQLIESRRIIGS